MRLLTIVGVVVLSAVTAAAQAGGQAGPPTAGTGTAQGAASAQPAGGAGDAAVKAVADSYVKAMLAGDAKGVAALYTEDAIEMPPHQPMIKGRTAIEQYYAKMLSGGVKIMAFTLEHIESRANGDGAWDVGTYKQSMQGETGTTTPPSDTGKYVVLLKRVDGAWKVAYAIYSSDMPAPGR
jgi:uncharacterized protein (TIGR02246 family)